MIFCSSLLKNEVINLLHNGYYLNISNENISLSLSSIGKEGTNVRIINFFKCKDYFKCYIEQINTKFRLGLNKENNTIIFFNKSQENYSDEWTFINKNTTNYYIKNNIGCYLKVINYEIICEFISIDKADDFQLIKIYEELLLKQKYERLIEKEPIDVLIKYIDLKDPTLERNNIHQIEKDIDNEELRYSIRSILKNIPWVRKIYILMPNKKVRFLKNYDLIRNKIIYVKDKDLLGFDSSNSLAFQFRLWKMKKFGISDNFIVMDDDCFIGKPLKKSDLFYVKNNKVIPLTITSKFHQVEKKNAEEKLISLQELVNKIKEEQNAYSFEYSQYLTYLFIINIFERSQIIIPKFTHNAIPVNSKELKEIYNLIFKSEFNETTLFCKYRHIKTLQFQTFVLAYTFIKYRKKVKDISYKYIVNNHSIHTNYNTQLFCINTIPIGNTNISFLITRIVMEKLFPQVSPYEIIDYSLTSLSYRALKLMSLELKNINMEYYEELNNNNQLSSIYFYFPNPIIIINLNSLQKIIYH